MHNYIIALGVSPVRSKVKVAGDFESIEAAENFMVEGNVGVTEIVTLKRQDRNQWWAWGPQGWEPIVNEDVEKASETQEMSNKVAQQLITSATIIEADMRNRPTGNVEHALQRAHAIEYRANAALIIANAHRVFLEVVLEAHGNVEWPMIT